ncbi:MAG: NfeD family protein [Bacilli bacterium]|nr:NfeD family protein [Bacilli bacterium]
MQWILWLVVIALLVFLEVITINLVSIWFIVSGLVSLFLSFVVDSFYIQFAVFVVLGLILMIITRPILVKKFGRSDVKTNLDRVIGMEGVVTEEISKLKVGEVKVDGKRWSAVSDAKISVGDTVIVEEVSGVKLVVRKGEK